MAGCLLVRVSCAFSNLPPTLRTPFSSMKGRLSLSRLLVDRWNKRHHPQRNLQPGDVVILREDKRHVNTRPLGRIEEVYPGQNGLVQVVKIKTSQGIYRRPIAKIAPLLD